MLTAVPEITAPCLLDGMTDAAYRAAPGLSASEAKILLGKRPPEESPALTFGTLVHTLVLEPDKADRYTPADAEKIGVKADGTPAQNPLMTGAWKAFVAAAQAEGRTIVAQSDWDRARSMADAVHAHRTARQVLDLCGRREVSGWATHPTGVLVKGRIDLLGGGMVADLKTTKDADPDRFAWTCTDFLYHVSGANYLDIALAAGEDVQGVTFINVEKEPTLSGAHRVSVVEIPERAVNRGRDLMARACERFLSLGRVDLPDYGDGWHTKDLPPRAYYDTDDYQENPA